MYFVGPEEVSRSGGSVEGGGNGCTINDRFYRVGRAYEDKDLCVEVECVDRGEVSVNKLRGRCN